MLCVFLYMCVYMGKDADTMSPGLTPHHVSARIKIQIKKIVYICIRVDADASAILCLCIRIGMGCCFFFYTVLFNLYIRECI